jgi:hypothetical protein
VTDHVHVSDLRFDQLIAGDLDAVATTAMRAELAGCAQCTSRLAQLTRESQAFVARPLPPRRASRWWLVAPVVVAAAAAVVLVMMRLADERIERVDDPGGARIKGSGPVLVVSVGRDVLVEVASGDRIHPGDTVQAAYTAERAGYGAVLSRDGSGNALAYVPPAGDVMIALPAGKAMPFPFSTQLDDVVGDEVLVVIWCEGGPLGLAPLLTELAARGDIAPRDGCTQRRLVLRKEPR